MNSLFLKNLKQKKVKNHEAFNKENIAETHAADGSSFKNTASLSKMKKSFPLSEQDIHNDKKFQKLSHAFQEKNKALENSILPLHQKRKIASEFTTVAHDIVCKDPRYKSFQKALTKKLDELTRHIPYNHNLKGDIRNFSQQKFKEIFGEDTPFHLATITQPFAPSDISSINESSKTYVNAVSTSRYDTIIKPNKKLIADDGYYSTKRQGITNISQDPRAQKLITNIKSQWQKIQKEPLSNFEKEAKISDYAVKETHNIFGDYDKLNYEIKKQKHLSDSEKAFYKKHGNRNRDLVDYKKGQFVCSQYSNIVSYALKKGADIDTTGISFSYIRPNKKTGRHAMLFLDKHDAIIEATNAKTPIRTVEPNTLQNIIAQKTNIIKSTTPGKRLGEVRFIFTNL